MNVFSLLQQHTIDIYGLRDKQYEIETVAARSLLSVKRFDLFAKLYYIRYLSVDKGKAMSVYGEHIKAFNPDMKEPGRSDKSSITNFVDTFDALIDTFKENDFDETLSLIPVGGDNVILDGAHRVATLAYYDKNVTIAWFKDVDANVFDYDYFKKRGLNWDICDTIAMEMTRWVDDLKAVCIWPSVKDKTAAIEVLSSEYNVGYMKLVKIPFTALVEFVGNIYSHQSWTSKSIAVRDKANHCYGRGKEMCLMLIDAPYTEELVGIKEKIRKIYGMGNHSLHISDNQNETAQMVACALSVSSKKDAFSEFVYRFRYIHWLEMKVFVARILNNIKKAL